MHNLAITKHTDHHEIFVHKQWINKFFNAYQESFVSYHSYNTAVDIIYAHFILNTNQPGQSFGTGL